MTKKSPTGSPSRPERREAGSLARPGSSKTPLSGSKRAKPDPKLPVQPDAALAMRRLRRQLADALAKIEHLQASAETDVLLGVLNRRGFERELGRALAYITRYRATGALIVI